MADFNSFTFSKEKRSLLQEVKNMAAISFISPFPLTKVKDEIFDPANNIDKVLIFRNRYFKEKTVIRLKFEDKGNTIDCGYIFSFRGITETDNIVKENRVLALYASRALVSLLHNNTSLPANIPDLNRAGGFTLQDFYEDDLVICVISKTQLSQYNEDIELSILFQLNLYGFYLLNSNQNRNFQPESNDYQKSALSSIIRPDNTGNLTLFNLSKKITGEPFFIYYITGLINNEMDYLAKFFSIYQCYEILIDHVTREEIKVMIGTPGNLDNKSGYSIKNEVNKIGDEGYRIERLFNKYADFNHGSDKHINYAMGKFLIDYRPDYDLRKKQSCGDTFYDLRNTLVHSLRICFTGSQNEIQKKISELKALVTDIEFLTAEAIVGLKL